MNESLRKTLRQLRLSGLLESLEIRLQEAAGHGLSHAEFLELIVQDELAVRGNRKLDRRFKAAQFRERKSLEDFDWSFNPSIPRKQIYDLASCRFLREGRDVLWLGPPGVGKSFMVQAIGYQAIKAGYTVYYRSIFDLVRDFLHDEVLGQEDKILNKYLKPELLIIDDMGMKQLPRRSGECLFEVVMRRYETRSTMMTSNRPLEDWGKLLGDAPGALGDSGSVPAPRRAGANEWAELPPAKSFGFESGRGPGFKTSQCALRLGGEAIEFKTSHCALRVSGKAAGFKTSHCAPRLGRCLRGEHPCRISPAPCRQPGAHCRPWTPLASSLFPLREEKENQIATGPIDRVCDRCKVKLTALNP